jgi:hypothetical protein
MTTTISTRGRAAAALALALIGCGPPDARTSAPRVTRVDSAGFEIVTSATPAAAVPVFATLDSTPDLRLGAVDGPAEEQFGSVVGLAPLSDGAVAVLDGQAAEIRVFGPQGAFRRTLGRKGEGPGELSGPRNLALVAGDTLAVYDQRAARVTLFPLDGAPSRVVTVAFDNGLRPLEASFFSDGTLLGSSPWASHRPLPTDGNLTFTTDSAALVVHQADGSIRDTVDVLASGETLFSITASARMVNVFKRSAVFGRSGVFAASPDGVWSGFADHFALRLLDAGDGRVKRIVRAPGLERPLTDGEAKAILDRSLETAATPEERRTAQQVYDLSPHPALRPAYSRLVVDDQARLWLQDWQGADTTTNRWWVFSRDGALLGSVDVPGRLQLMAVRNDRAWGVVRDGLDVAYVVRFMVRTGA